MMYDFLYKLQVTGQLKFTEGHITILGHPSLMLIPEEAFLTLQEELIKKDPYKLYQAGRRAGEELYELIAHHTLNQKAILKYGINLINLSGFGKLTIVAHKLEEGKAVFNLEESIAATLKIEDHTCHYMRGLLAGFTQETTKKELECIEEKCMSMGAKTCQFLIKPRNQFNPTSELTQKQLQL